jgi:hypothetical protein
MLFHRLPLKACALNGLGYNPAFTKARTLRHHSWRDGGGEASLLYTQNFSKIAAVHATAWHFGNESLDTTNFCVKGHEKSMDTALYYF